MHQLSGYSAHADQNNLADWVGAMETKPKEIRLVHGEAGAKTALSKQHFQKGLEFKAWGYKKYGYKHST
ncbi:MAG: MBL fold metallo-hydrolase RNA specificity domain-containing protein [Thermodesulfobacteriota bacterium]|nr:MBL fold metallo-hydrolase RNA specificity domain-containing protein [Thermodesulfobacteriota bacterium]